MADTALVLICLPGTGYSGGTEHTDENHRYLLTLQSELEPLAPIKCASIT